MAEGSGMKEGGRKQRRKNQRLKGRRTWVKRLKNLSIIYFLMVKGKEIEEKRVKKNKTEKTDKQTVKKRHK